MREFLTYVTAYFYLFFDNPRKQLNYSLMTNFQLKSVFKQNNHYCFKLYSLLDCSQKHKYFEFNAV